MWMLLAYPILGIPIGLAYLARYAFESQLGFYGVLLLTFGLSVAFYSVAMDTAEQGARDRKEMILVALTQGEGPIGGMAVGADGDVYFSDPRAIRRILEEARAVYD